MSTVVFSVPPLEPHTPGWKHIDTTNIIQRNIKEIETPGNTPSPNWILFQCRYFTSKIFEKVFGIVVARTLSVSKHPAGVEPDRMTIMFLWRRSKLIIIATILRRGIYIESLLNFTNFFNLTLILNRLEDHLDVIHICDISSSGSKPKEEEWSFSMMIEAMKTEEASLIKFSFYDLEVRFRNTSVYVFHYMITILRISCNICFYITIVFRTTLV